MVGLDKEGPLTNETFNYASIVRMLMYLARNSHLEISFAVYQCARFTHNLKALHEAALKKIGKYISSKR